MGRAINPRAIQGQIQGGVVQGLGYALHEEVTLPPDGRIPQNGFETYRLLQAGDALPVQIDLYEGAPSLGPLGAKGAGEIPILNAAAAVVCAVANAMGTRVQEILLTPFGTRTAIWGRCEVSSRPYLLRELKGNVLGRLKNNYKFNYNYKSFSFYFFCISL